MYTRYTSVYVVNLSRQSLIWMKFTLEAPATRKRLLSRKRILKTALCMVRESGLQAVKVRPLADRLGVTPMAIYRHFQSKDALMAALLDEFIANADLLPAKELEWDAWMRHVGGGIAAALSDEPGWIDLLGHIEMNPDSQALMLRGLQTLLKAGFSASQAMRGFFTLAHIAVGAAFVTQGIRQVAAGPQQGRHDKNYLDDLGKRFGALPALIEAQRVDHGIEFLIVGMRSQLNPDRIET